MQCREKGRIRLKPEQCAGNRRTLRNDIGAQQADPADSYSAQLLADLPWPRKLGEEASETMVAALRTDEGYG